MSDELYLNKTEYSLKVDGKYYNSLDIEGFSLGINLVLIKAICDQIYNIVDSSLGFSLSYEQIFERFAENYWNLILKYGIRQMSYNGKSEFSKIESIILNASQCYDIPEGTPFTSVNAEDREKIIKQTTK